MSPGDFLEVYVKVSLAIAEQRDPKGLYKKARAGEITQFTGIDDSYEVPMSPELVINTEASDPVASADHIISYLEARGILRS
jgi:adenylylsulfate kinase-like enzyme